MYGGGCQRRCGECARAQTFTLWLTFHREAVELTEPFVGKAVESVTFQSTSIDFYLNCFRSVLKFCPITRDTRLFPLSHFFYIWRSVNNVLVFKIYLHRPLRNRWLSSLRQKTLPKLVSRRLKLIFFLFCTPSNHEKYIFVFLWATRTLLTTSSVRQDLCKLLSKRLQKCMLLRTPSSHGRYSFVSFVPVFLSSDDVLYVTFESYTLPFVGLIVCCIKFPHSLRISQRFEIISVFPIPRIRSPISCLRFAGGMWYVILTLFTYCLDWRDLTFSLTQW